MSVAVARDIVAESLSDAVGAASAGYGVAPLSDRRRSIRHPAGTIGVLTSEQPSCAALHVRVTNVSIHGVGFRSPVNTARGNLYEMKIGTGPLFLATHVRVTSSCRSANGHFDVGAEFV